MRGSEGRQVAPIASPSPVGSAKFGARVGGLVSPTLVGAGVPVGTRVGAAHAHTRTVRVQLMCPDSRRRAGGRVRFLCARHSGTPFCVHFKEPCLNTHF